ncbi:hypothetical protein [Actinoplanes couchii]|uniref:Uncharacterized protein n=1 Tax=Actinoplanes couchii TaxID=403638 RepID=A0ABQ3X3M6_9ACTN|nr:hypothetical protein [Actinoplanes couchii]MDR6322854.1 hypothetical protein [Actinoplanes couchii]GID53093.1 hypothetical protein Aco03nite_014970 [Actinoplanes couchii]
MLGADRWNTLPERSAMTAERFATTLEPLLQGVADAVTGFDPEVLNAQIRATLATAGRETSLPLTASAGEFAGQAAAIGAELAAWAGDALARLAAAPIGFPAGPLVVRSRCDGHLLTPDATEMLMGARGGPVAIQLYNEWLHQTVLLRDALLPFANWRETPLLVTPRGLRHTEQARERFLAELLFRRVRHTSVVEYARRVVTGDGGPAGYGFDHDGGTVLPAVVDGDVLAAPRYLLRWRPGAGGTDATWVPAVEDYAAEGRTAAIGVGTATGGGPLAARITATPAKDGVRTAVIEVTRDGATTRVDLGQALRGHRFASGGPAAGDGPVLGAWPVLTAPGLVENTDGDAVLPAEGDDLVLLALLGRLYPENVVLAGAPGRPQTPPGVARTVLTPAGVLTPSGTRT